MNQNQDYFLTHQLRYQFLLKKIAAMNLPKGAKVLDVGCWPLHLFQALEKKGFQVWGIASPHEKVRRPRVTTVNIETNQFPFKTNFFDLILFAEILEHLPHNPLIPLKKIRRVLKPGGALIISTPNAVGLKNRARILLGQNIYFTLDQLLEALPQNGKIYHLHNREYTMKEVIWLLKKAGFKVKAQEYYIGSGFRQLSAKGLTGKTAALGAKIIQQFVPSCRNYLFTLAIKPT